jgi:hypothetical protein
MADDMTEDRPDELTQAYDQDYGYVQWDAETSTFHVVGHPVYQSFQMLNPYGTRWKITLTPEAAAKGFKQEFFKRFREDGGPRTQTGEEFCYEDEKPYNTNDTIFFPVSLDYFSWRMIYSDYPESEHGGGESFFEYYESKYGYDGFEYNEDYIESPRANAETGFFPFCKNDFSFTRQGIHPAIWFIQQKNLTKKADFTQIEVRHVAETREIGEPHSVVFEGHPFIESITVTGDHQSPVVFTLKEDTDVLSFQGSRSDCYDYGYISRKKYGDVTFSADDDGKPTIIYTPKPKSQRRFGGFFSSSNVNEALDCIRIINNKEIEREVGELFSNYTSRLYDEKNPRKPGERSPHYWGRW